MRSHPPLSATLYLECASGVSGDMLAAALLALCAQSAASGAAEDATSAAGDATRRAE